MSKKICFITGTRADYGILAPVMREILKSPEAQLQVIATNMHLSPEFGMTVDEIEKDGVKVDVRIESLVPGGTSSSTVLSMAKVQEGLAGAFEELQPDIVVILGDRYEALAAASAAVAFNIPVAHLHGGETTEGAIDNRFRHAITQLSTLHFASTPQYADKIITMGEDSSCVFHSGAPGAERYIEPDDTDTEEFYKMTGISPYEPFILLAFHPVTLAHDKGMSELEATLGALDTFINQGYKVLVTLPNSDPGTVKIQSKLKEWVASETSKTLVTSLGSRLFHYALDNAAAIIGNSSAALIEAPSHRLGAVNVGIRQKGRAHGLTVLSVPGDQQKIENALKAVLSLEMKAVLMGMPVSTLNPYFKENAAAFIAEKLINFKPDQI